MKKVFEIFAVLVLVAVTVCGITNYKAKAAMDVTDNVADNAKSLAAAIVDAAESKEVYEITNVEVKHELSEIGEISTYELEYSGTDEIVSYKEKLGHKIPGSTYTVNIIYNGTIKAGYDFSDIDVTVDNGNKKITVKLPDAKILQNSTDLSTLKSEADESFFSKVVNPIPADAVTKRLSVIEKDELTKAINEDKILDLARDNAMTIIKDTLTVFEYEVIFEG